MSEHPFDYERARALREQTTDTYSKLLRQGLIANVLITVPFAMLLSYAMVQCASSPDPAVVRHWALVYFLSFLFITLIWSILAITGRQLFLVKEIKQLRLDLLAVRNVPPEAATGGAESFSPWSGVALRPKMLGLLMGAVCGGAALLTFAANEGIQHYLRTHWSTYESFGGQEVVDVHVTPEGRIRAYSRVSITKCPSSIQSMPIRIAQPGAVLESVTIAGRDVPFSPDPGKDGVYNLMPGLPENALKNAMLEAVYLLPVTLGGEQKLVKFQLEGLIPFSSYAANVLIEKGAPFRFGDKWGDETHTPLFWTKRSDGSYGHKGMGCCSIPIKPAS